MNPFSATRWGGNQTRNLIALTIFIGFFSASPWSGADEQVRQVQEELRRRNLYFGEVDGRNTEEIHEAMRRYQHRKGFPVTGVFEQETLRSLGIQLEPAAVGTAEQLPDVPVLKSDSAREVSEKDRKFLEDLDASEPPPGIGEGPPADVAAKAPRAPVPPGHLPSPSEREKPRPALPESTPSPKLSSEPAANVSSSSSHDSPEIASFVRAYLNACQTNDLQQEMAFYADMMHYFDQGTVGREFVERDVRRYYKRWPHRDYTLLSLSISQRPNASSEFVVRFRIRYALSSDKAHASGQTDNVFVVKSEGGRLKFTSLQESRVHG